MFLGFETTLFLYGLLASIYWTLRPYNTDVPLVILVVCNLALLTIANPVLVFYLAAQFFLIFILFVISAWRNHRFNSWLPWLAFLGLLPMNLAYWHGSTPGVPRLFGQLGAIGLDGVTWVSGSTFFVIKSFIALKESIRLKSFDTLPILGSLTFLPSFPAGPIFGAAPFRRENLKVRLSFDSFRLCVLKMGWGAAALLVIAPKLSSFASALPDQGIGFLGKSYLVFASLYFDFSGYSLLAISFAAMFGIVLPENFNRPYLATNIREFWKRWHMSLNAFIGTYLFNPFLRLSGMPRVGIFVSFICAGIWHKVSVAYLLWGIGHGTALVLCMKPPTFWKNAVFRFPVAMKCLSWGLTMSYVAFLSQLGHSAISLLDSP